MGILDKAETRLGRYAIPGLLRIVAGFQLLAFVLVHVNQQFLNFLVLDREAVLQGQIWRLVSYVFIPPTLSPIWIIFAVWFLWFIGEGLEQAWGAFKLNVYFFLGILGTAAAAFIFPAVLLNGGYLFTSLFFAFAVFYPDQEIYLFLILPIKVKFLAYFAAIALAFGFVTSQLPVQAATLLSLSNFFIFFTPRLVTALKLRSEVKARRRDYDEHRLTETEAFHKCHACGRTEVTDPELEFRVARDGEEYCLEHLPSAAKKAEENGNLKESPGLGDEA